MNNYNLIEQLILLLENSNPENENFNPKAQERILDICKVIYEDEIGKEGCNALCASCFYANSEAVKILLDRGFNLNFQNVKKISALNLLISSFFYGNNEERYHLLIHVLKLPDDKLDFYQTDIYGRGFLFNFCDCFDIQISGLLEIVLEKMKHSKPPKKHSLHSEIARDISLHKVNGEYPMDDFYNYHRFKTCFLVCISNLSDVSITDEDMSMYEESVFRKIILLFRYGNPKEIMDIKFNLEPWVYEYKEFPDKMKLPNNCLFFFLLYSHGNRFAIDVEDEMEPVMDGIITINQDFSVKLFKFLFDQGLRPRSLPQIIKYHKKNHSKHPYRYRGGDHIFAGLHLCYLNENIKLAKLLIELKLLSFNEVGISNTTKFLIGYRDYFDYTVLQKAIMDRNAELIDIILRNLVDVNVLSNNTQVDALYFAVNNNDIETVKKLLKLGSPIEKSYSVQNILLCGDRKMVLPKNFRPLHVAMAKGSFDIVSLLIDNGDNKDEKINCEVSPRELSYKALETGFIIKPLHKLVIMEFTPFSDFSQIMRTKGTHLSQEEENCVICFENIDLEGENIILLKCGHFFHSKCLIDSLTRGLIETDSYSYKAFCPMCKAGMDREEDFEIMNVSRVRMKDLGKIKYKTKKRSRAQSLNNTLEFVPYSRIIEEEQKRMFSKKVLSFSKKKSSKKSKK